MKRKYNVKLIWDVDEEIWYSKSLDEGFGVTLESESLDELIKRVKTAVPELLEQIGYSGDTEIAFEIDRTDRLFVAEY